MTEITEQQVKEFQAKQAAAERKQMRKCVDELVALARGWGFIIVGVPQLAQDGRITATWGIQKKN